MGIAVYYFISVVLLNSHNIGAAIVNDRAKFQLV